MKDRSFRARNGADDLPARTYRVRGSARALTSPFQCLRNGHASELQRILHRTYHHTRHCTLLPFRAQQHCFRKRFSGAGSRNASHDHRSVALAGRSCSRVSAPRILRRRKRAVVGFDHRGSRCAYLCRARIPKFQKQIIIPIKAVKNTRRAFRRVFLYFYIFNR